MFKNAMLAAVAALSLPAGANAETRSVNRDGIRATYVRTAGPDGTVRIEGRYATGQRFRFTVSPYGRVRGDVGGQNLQFSVEEAKRELARGAS